MADLSVLRNELKSFSDLLDAAIAEHAEKKEMYERIAKQWEEYQKNYVAYDQSFNKLLNVKSKAVIEQIEKILSDVDHNGEDKPLILDVISVSDNETEEENVNNGDDHGKNDGNNGVGDDQEMAETETETPLVENQINAAAEQNGNGDDAEMVVAVAAEVQRKTRSSSKVLPPQQPSALVCVDCKRRYTAKKHLRAHQQLKKHGVYTENVHPQAPNQDATNELQTQQSSAAAATISIAPVPNGSSSSSAQFVKSSSAPVNASDFAEQNVRPIKRKRSNLGSSQSGSVMAEKNDDIENRGRSNPRV